MNEVHKKLAVLKNAGFIVKYKDQNIIEVYSVYNQYVATINLTELIDELVMRKLLIRDSMLRDLKVANDFVEATQVILESHTTSLSDAELTEVEMKNSRKNKFKYLLVVIPKSSRAECIADLQEIIADMKADNCSKFYIGFTVILNIASVAYHALFFKLQGYFYPAKQQSKND
ncbi:hypothetical protein [Kordia jejudonensis]|uniref:hypothetical protein n=1 Tax=Kordia jejudonensis TaxID=1348245 RepID=UPI000629C6D3|nr:hypothetical protein [Kordia jejudonensis]